MWSPQSCCNNRAPSTHHEEWEACSEAQHGQIHTEACCQAWLLSIRNGPTTARQGCCHTESGPTRGLPCPLAINITCVTVNTMTHTRAPCVALRLRCQLPTSPHLLASPRSLPACEHTDNTGIPSQHAARHTRAMHDGTNACCQQLCWSCHHIHIDDMKLGRLAPRHPSPTGPSPAAT